MPATYDHGVRALKTPNKFMQNVGDCSGRRNQLFSFKQVWQFQLNLAKKYATSSPGLSFRQ